MCVSEKVMNKEVFPVCDTQRQLSIFVKGQFERQSEIGEGESKGVAALSGIRGDWGRAGWVRLGTVSK